MLRVLCAVFALFAVMAVTEAQAQPKACKKVDIRFSCRGSGSGTVKLNCRPGETEAKCCARHRRAAADPRHGWCTGRGEGLASFNCGCADRKGGKERLAPLGGVRGDAAPKSKGKVEHTWKVEEGETGNTAGPGLKRLQKKGKTHCPRVAYSFQCRRTGGGQGLAGCRAGESEPRCCARVRQSVGNACANQGGVARFQCACPKKPGDKAAGPLTRFGRTGGGSSKRTESTGRTSRSKACRHVSFSYTCGGSRREGGRECRNNESEQDCCSYAFSLEARKCGRTPERWRCRCDDRSRGRGLRQRH